MRRFSNTHRHGKHKDPEAVLRCLILYCQGYSLEQVAEWLWRKKKMRVSTSTLHRWVNEFEVPYLEIRDLNAGDALRLV
jgi:IS30 family transposase